jgi:flavin reductase (DIM6/NTAB) family NADH-FMN oxidoreductase RutF
MEHFAINPENIKDNPFDIIGKGWFLLTAGDLNSYNTMTAAWGGFGVLWHKDVCTVFVRPNRYTYEFMEKNDTFSLSFFEEKYKKTLNFCGNNSGRDVDKASETGLTPAGSDNNTVYFKESRLFIICKKLYFQDILPGNFLDPAIDKLYPQKDYHRMYVGEILNAYIK